MKIHESWNALKHSKKEWEFWNFEEYYKRIQKILIHEKYPNIPKEVFEQWIYWLHQNEQTLENYAWMNYKNIKFELCKWGFEKLQNVHIIEEYQPYFKTRCSYSDFSEFCCNEEDWAYWEKYWTWRIPPIILDIQSLTQAIPKRSEIKWPYQLVEGHSRMWYLHSMNTISRLNKWKIAKEHLVYIMKENA